MLIYDYLCREILTVMVVGGDTSKICCCLPAIAIYFLALLAANQSA